MVSNRKPFLTNSNINIHTDEVLSASTYAAVILINSGIFSVGNWHALDFKRVTIVTVLTDVKDITTKFS